ncbi:hypothetical protein SSX86_004501 [Deinandra increscens subsp. villosa]|uniref:YABBY family protein n=1 Tax=Deinandra increscens subsp. villosa TaxID=3103831 RepID=A0AAP0H600_9ASTR
MSTLNHLLDHDQLQAEQICYVQCGFCTTVLVVCVPYRCFSTVFTVKCGHCTSLFSVNMMRPSFLPIQLLPSVDNQEDPIVEASEDQEVPKLTFSKHSSSPLISSSSSIEDNDDLEEENHVVNQPPQKRQRAPSAYNNFIKDEIKRLKTQDPNMSHKQAFTTASKNWARGPRISQHESQHEDDKEEEDKSN